MPESIPNMQLTTSVEGAILEKTKERIRALTLEGIDPDRIVVRKMPWVEDLTQLPLPHILVTPPPETTSWQDGTNEQDETVFAVMVAIVLADKRDVTEHFLGTHLFWRERIRRKFQNKSVVSWSDLQDALSELNGNNYFIRSYVESGDKFIEAAKREQRDASYYLIRVVVREPRE